MDLLEQPELALLWGAIRAELRHMVGESTYDIWLAPLQLRAWDGAVLRLEAPADTQVWIAERFGRVLESCARIVLGPATAVVFATTDNARGRLAPAPTPQPESDDVLNPRYSFQQFIIGEGNQLAHAAALAVAEMPGQAYNPLFLHAPPGLGKTHLLHAIGNYVLAFGDGATVRYTTIEAFTNHFIRALGTRSVDRFKRSYRDADVLLIDDVQFLASKVKTEEEFFHTFNTLYETGRQLVLTCDRLPTQLAMVEQRLRERFECGLVADIRPPDFATRHAILRKRAALDGISLADPAVLEMIAERITSNVRSLEGALIRVVAHHSLARRPIDIEFATAVLDGMNLDSCVSQPAIGTIQAAVAAFYKLTVPELISPSRTARIVWPRQVAIHLVRVHTDESLQTIGKAFGGRNHATVLHACKRVDQRLQNDHEGATEIADLSRTLRHDHADRTC